MSINTVKYSMKSQAIRVTFPHPPSVSLYPFGVELLTQHQGFWRLSVSKASGWTASEHQNSNLHT